MPLNRDEIRHRILTQNLITGYIDLEAQLQLVSFDLTLEKIRWFSSRGIIGFREKTICDYYEMAAGLGDAFILEPGAYNVEFKEIIKLPLDLCAFSRQRSSLMRNGALTSSGSWDPGYHGRGQALLVVLNPNGLKLLKDARIHQITFFKIDELGEGYKGDFQGEGIPINGQISKTIASIESVEEAIDKMLGRDINEGEKPSTSRQGNP